MVKCSECENSYPKGENKVRCTIDKFKHVRIANRERYCNVNESLNFK